MLIYVAAPVGRGPERAANLERARRWFPWLVRQHPDDALLAPWMTYCQVLDETPENRARGMRDDLEVLRHCDGIALVGGILSPGMAGELTLAHARQMTVFDYLHLGPEPPAFVKARPHFPTEEDSP